MSSEDISARDLFAGRYQLMHCLGRGGMGEVYLAVDTLLDNQLVALKIIHADLCRNEKYTKRFLREIYATRLITDPSVVRTFDAGIERGRPYFSMEYICGATLADELDDPSFGITLLEGLCIFYRICSGLAAIHEADVIHRDLKPSNIILAEDGSVKISDFGLARTGSSAITQSSELAGTASYVAPELIDGAQASSAVDIYALGVIAYEIFTGRLPFEADNDWALMVAPMRQTPKNPREFVPELPEWLGGLILAMLNRAPEPRPAIRQIVEHIARQAENRSGSRDVLLAPYVLKTDIRSLNEESFEPLTIFGSGSGPQVSGPEIPGRRPDTSSPATSLISRSLSAAKAVRPHSRIVFRVLLLGLLASLGWHLGFSDSSQERRASPGGITGLAGWYRADALLMPDGGPVSRIPDKSRFNNSATQTLSDHQPVFHRNAVAGYPAVRFDGKNDFLQLDGVAKRLRSSTGMTVIFVGRTDARDRYQYVWSSHLDNQEENLVHGGYSPGGGIRIRSIRSPFQRGFHDSHEVPTGEFAIISTVVDKRQVSAYFNSSTLFADSISYDIAFPRAAYFSIGQEYDADGPGDFFAGELAEFLVYDRALSEGERRKIEQLLSAKYKIGLRHKSPSQEDPAK